MLYNVLKSLLMLTGCIYLATGLVAQNTPAAPAQNSPSPVLVTDAPSASVSPNGGPPAGEQETQPVSANLRHSFLVPSFRISQTLDSNPLLLAANNGHYRGFTNLGGGVDLVQYLGRDAELKYSGAVRYDTRAALQGYSQFTNTQNVDLSKRMRFRTWQLLLDDAAQYTQGSNFGAAGMEGMGLISTQVSRGHDPSTQKLGSNALPPDTLPDESILTGRVGRIANTVLGEVNAYLGPRDTLTVAGSFALLHYDSSQLTDTNQTLAVVGLSHAISRRDSLAIEGAYTRFAYQNSDFFLSSEYFSGLYSRRISDRFTMEAGAGPQVTQSSIAGVDHQYVDWQARGTLQYRARLVVLSARGIRTISAGSGVLSGATNTVGEGTIDYRFSRYWSMSSTAGVSRNKELGSGRQFDSQFASLIFNRRTSRYTNIYASYDFQRQTAPSECTGPACVYNGLRNVFGIGFAWSYRPIGIP